MLTMTLEEAQNYPINITPMSREEARECINAIRGNLESLRLMLLELHRRRGWEALGYNSWEDCAVEEFGKSRSYVFRLLAAAEVQENLGSSMGSTIVDPKDIPVSQLTVLARLPLEQQAEGLLKAEEIAQAEGKKRNATHITQAVKEIKPKNQMPPSNSATQTDEQITAAGDADDDTTQSNQPESSPTPAPPRPTQMLSAAVEACLGDFTMPASLDEPLQGVVYVSPNQAIEKWVSKLLKAFKDGAVTEAIALLPLEHQVFVKFADYPLCPLNGFVAVYLGRRTDNFVLCFEDLGAVWHRYGRETL